MSGSKIELEKDDGFVLTLLRAHLYGVFCLHENNLSYLTAAGVFELELEYLE